MDTFSIIVFVIAFLFYHPIPKLITLHNRRKYIQLIHTYLNRLVFLYINDNRKQNEVNPEGFDHEFWSLHDKLFDKLNYWIITHNMDYYIRKYNWQHQSISNPIFPVQGYENTYGVQADVLILYILKECSSIDFEPYIKTATDTNFHYPNEKKEKWYECVKRVLTCETAFVVYLFIAYCLVTVLCKKYI